MAITLDTITSGYNLSKIDSNFVKIKDAINNDVLKREVGVNEANEMRANLDLNSNRIVNVKNGVDKQDVVTVEQLNLAAKNISDGDLIAVARAFNVLDTQVIDSSNTTNVLDSILYIYDSAAQKVWIKPDTVGAAETITTISGSSLTTSGGSYTLEEVRNTRAYDTLQDAVDSENLKLGDVVILKERTAGNGGGAIWDVVLLSTVTPDVYTKVACVGVDTLALVLRYTAFDVVNVREFGAVGDGTTVDTGAIQKCLDVAANVYFPEGRYKTGALTRSEGVRLLGDGIGRSVLLFDGTDGITITSNSDDYPVSISDLSFHQKGAGLGTAIKIDNSGQISGGVIQNRTSPRLKIENVAIRGDTDVVTDGWLECITCEDVMHGVIDGVHAEGYYAATPDSPATTHGIRFFGAGSPVELTVTNTWVFFTQDAMRVTDCEGVFVSHCNFVAVGAGIRFDPAAAEPQLQVTDNHINAYEVCVVADWIVDSNISNNLFFARADAVANVVGVQISNAASSEIRSNIFVNNSGFAYNGVVVVSNGGNVAIAENNFRIATTGVVLQAGSSGVRVGYNTYGTVTTNVTDSGTANIVAEDTLAQVGSSSSIGGLYEKWGSSVVTLNASGDGTITFGTAFPNAIFTAVVCNGDPTITPTESYIANQPSSNAAALAFSVRPNPGAISVRVNWIAKGN